MFIRLFDSTELRQRGCISVRQIVIDAAVATICVICAFFWFGIGFAAGEVGGPLPIGTAVLLWSLVLIVAVVGFVVRVGGQRSGWLAALLIPAILAALLRVLDPGQPGIPMGLRLGVPTSVVFLLGVAAGRVYIRRLRA